MPTENPIIERALEAAQSVLDIVKDAGNATADGSLYDFEGTKRRIDTVILQEKLEVLENCCYHAQACLPDVCVCGLGADIATLRAAVEELEARS